MPWKKARAWISKTFHESPSWKRLQRPVFLFDTRFCSLIFFLTDACKQWVLHFFGPWQRRNNSTLLQDQRLLLGNFVEVSGTHWEVKVSGGFRSIRFKFIYCHQTSFWKTSSVPFNFLAEVSVSSWFFCLYPWFFLVKIETVSAPLLRCYLLILVLTINQKTLLSNFQKFLTCFFWVLSGSSLESEACFLGFFLSTIFVDKRLLTPLPFSEFVLLF